MKLPAYLLVAFVTLFASPLLAQTTLVTGLELGQSESGAAAEAQDSSDGLDAQLMTPQGRVALALASPDYPVTPGDIYTVVFLSSSGPITVDAAVEADYRFALPHLRPIDARGLRYTQLRDMVEAAVLAAYPGSTPRMQIQSVGVFQVFVRGEVGKSGFRYAWGLDRVASQWRGVTSYASRRNVHVVSRDGKKASYDLFKAERDGDLAQNPYVRPFDTIEFVRFDRRVSLSGSVRRPGTYQLLPGETLRDLVERYGDGLVETANPTMLSVVRRLGAATELGESLTLDYRLCPDWALENLDSVSVPDLSQVLPAFFIEGAVGVASGGGTLQATNRVAHALVPGLTLSRLTQGMRLQFSPVSDLEHAFIRRGGELIPVDLGRYLYDKDFSFDLVLLPDDVLVVPFRQFFITVAGAVVSPGRFPYIPERGWEYYVNLAGGVDKERNSGNKLEILGKDGAKRPRNAQLEPEDTIVVASNSAIYTFGRVSAIIGTTISVASLVLGIMQLAQ